ncbi:hypothetical protein SKAU_G00348490 [Synaphobranchus kaupii]|uniref:Uncharacterized protein n=1 Tax=Synaphobranchus kaupii TaxID=118154 RepID=A0A9Q1IHX0_SYNKA|nr:hypothetical protein SKAU_G00348490 [Synaphobranchus kaupii]
MRPLAPGLTWECRLQCQSRGKRSHVLSHVYQELTRFAVRADPLKRLSHDSNRSRTFMHSGNASERAITEQGQLQGPQALRRSKVWRVLAVLPPMPLSHPSMHATIVPRYMSVAPTNPCEGDEGTGQRIVADLLSHLRTSIDSEAKHTTFFVSLYSRKSAWEELGPGDSRHTLYERRLSDCAAQTRHLTPLCSFPASRALPVMQSDCGGRMWEHRMLRGDCCKTL